MKKGGVVESEDDAVKMKSEYETIHADHRIFIDEELGCNTNKKQDDSHQKY